MQTLTVGNFYLTDVMTSTYKNDDHDDNDSNHRYYFHCEERKWQYLANILAISYERR